MARRKAPEPVAPGPAAAVPVTPPAGDSEQLTLTRLAELAYEDLTLPASAFPASRDLLSPAPTPDFIKNIKRRGILNPVHCHRGNDGVLRIMAGKRRVKAAREIDPEYPVPVRLYHNVPLWDALTIETADNACRRSNDLSDLMVLMKLHAEGKSLSWSMLPKGTIRKRMKIIGLEAPILQAVIDGLVSMATAEALARLLPQARQPFLEQLAAGQKVTSKMVAQCQWARAAALAEQAGHQGALTPADTADLFIVLTPELKLHSKKPVAGLTAAQKAAGKGNRVFKLVEM